MAKIYTKTGDQGSTSHPDGSRIPKNHPLIEVFGAIDECNAMIGLARSFNNNIEIGKSLLNIQKQLLLIGSHITPAKNNDTFNQHTIDLEQTIDHIEAQLPPLKKFILPAGGGTSAHLHVARTLARKAERRLVTLKQTTPIDESTQIYFNRLSDTLFVLARLAAYRNKYPDE